MKNEYLILLGMAIYITAPLTLVAITSWKHNKKKKTVRFSDKIQIRYF